MSNANTTTNQTRVKNRGGNNNNRPRGEPRVNSNDNTNHRRENSKKTENLVFTTIQEGEDYVNRRAVEIGKRFQGRWAGILLEAVPQGYRVIIEKNENEFLKKIEDPRYRHWA